MTARHLSTGDACLRSISAETIVGQPCEYRVMDVGEHKGANQADRWRKRMRQGRRWRLSRNFLTWLLILAMVAITSTLIALNAHWRF
ncbi:hypothetical protein X742_00290 [Mesorhizobium sp. LNHC232B00]|nr:hypothetical protein X742_00290 [Mesorhizobium sp. LNHC232B00]